MKNNYKIMTHTAIVLFCNMHVALLSAQEVANQPQKQVDFDTYGIGQYEIQVPTDMDLLWQVYNHSLFSIHINKDLKKAKERSNYIDYLSDSTSVENSHFISWQSYDVNPSIEKAMYKNNGHNHLEISQDDKSDIKSITYEIINNKWKNSDKPRIFYTYFLKYFSDTQTSTAIASRPIHIARNAPNADAVLNQRINEIKQVIDKIEYHPVPNDHAGFCLTENTILSNTKSQNFDLNKDVTSTDDQNDPNIENYGVEFSGKTFNDNYSSLKFQLNRISDSKTLESKLNQPTGLIMSFASIRETRELTVAGRKGRLFIFDTPIVDKEALLESEPSSIHAVILEMYASRSREHLIYFRWVSTDSKVNSVPFAHIEIDGEMAFSSSAYASSKTHNVIDILSRIKKRPNSMI